jgi:phosphoribosyl 1,2-cyclic phosphodiesterase
MSLELCVLASGSMGNASVLRTPVGAMLVDLGIGPRTLARRLAGSGVQVSDIRAACLTHLDRDHFSPTWVATLLKFRITVHCHASRINDLLRLAGDPRLDELICPFDEDSFSPLEGLTATPLQLAHDQCGSHGFVLDGFGCRIGYATDLGRVPSQLLEKFCDLDVLALESNYDPRMQLDSDRPWFLKRRIMGGRGHLSNAQALSAIGQLLDRCQKQDQPLPRHIVLLHRSQQCNCPKLLRRLFSHDARIAPRLTLAEQHTRTAWLCASGTPATAGQQLLLAWG